MYFLEFSELRHWFWFRANFVPLRGKYHSIQYQYFINGPTVKGYFGMMCKTYTTIIPSNEFKCLCIEAEGEGGQNFSVQDPRGAKM